MAEVTGLRNNALPYPVYGSPWGATFPILDADGDLVTGATGLDSEVSKNGDTFADCTNEATEIATSSGAYYLLLTGTEMTSDVVTVIIKTSSAGAKTTTLTFYPRKLVTLRAGTAAGGAAGSITLDSGASAVDDTYNGCLVVGVLDSTTEARVISDYAGSTKVASVTPNWNTTPDSDDTFTVYLPEGMQVVQADLRQAAGIAYTSGAIPAAVAGAAGGLMIAGSNAATTFATLTVSGAVSFGSTFGVTGTVTFNALTVTNATTLSGAVSLGSTLGVTGATTFAAISATTIATSGTVTFNALTVSNATTLTGAVSLGSTLGVTGTATFAAITATTITTSGTVTFNALTVTNTTTLTGAVTASNTSNNIVGIDVAKLAGTTQTAGDLIPTITAIGTVIGSGFNVDAATDNTGGGISGVTSGTTFVGVQTSGTFASTTAQDGVYHVITHSGNAIDIVYQFLTGSGTKPVSCQILGYLNGNNDEASISVWDHVGGAWEAMATIPGQSGSVNFSHNCPLYARNMGTSAGELGKVYLRIHCTGQTAPVLNVDQVYVTYGIVASTLDAAGVRSAVGLASANLDTQLLAIDDAIDTEVAAILEDTGTTLPAQISALNNLSQADIRTAVGLASANLDTQLAAILAATGALTASERNAIADAILKRDVDNVEATAAIHSLASVALKLVSRFNASTGITYRTDGSTTHMTQTPTTNANLTPIEQLGVAS